jgi:hypothetical protein
MKKVHDPLDDELKKRLEDYTEEPNDALWSGIASNIQSVPSSPAWKKPALWTASLIVVSLITFVVTRSIYNVDDKSFAGTQTVNEQPSPVGMNSNDSVSNRKEVVQPHDISNETSNNELRKTEKKHSNGQVRTDERSFLLENRNDAKSLVDDNSYLSVDKKSIETNTTSNENFNTDDSGASVSPLNEQQISKAEKEIAVVPIVNNTTISDAGKSNAENASQTDSDKEIASSLSVESAAVDSVSGLKPETALSQNPSEKLRQQAGEETANKDKKGKSEKFNLYLTAMPTFGYNRIEANKDDNVMIESIGKVSNFSTKRLGIRVELGAEYAISRRTRVFAGLLYYQRKQTIDYVEKTVENVVQEKIADTTIVFDPQYSYEDKTFEYELKNIGVQFGINYILSEGKFIHFVGTGIEFHKALNKLPEGNTPAFGSAPSTYVFYNLYYRLQYPAKGKLRGIFQPTFNYSLYLNQDKNAPFYVKPYGLGLNVGVTYNF